MVEALEARGIVPRVFSWAETIADNRAFCAAAAEATWVKIGSPGEDAGVAQALMSFGAQVQSVAEPEPLAHGELRDTDLWFEGFRQVLSEFPDAAYLNAPDSIVAMFDKLAMAEKLSAHKVPHPTVFGPVESFEQLRDLMGEHETTRAFVKLRYGSSASGVVAVRMNRNRVEATTSVEMTSDGMFNNLRISHYRSNDDVRRLIEGLAAQQAFAQAWVPKATFRGRTFDLRVVAIDGQASHAVMRTSKGPLTNLHLGNDRGDFEAFKAETTVWPMLSKLAVDATQAFNTARVGGVDIALDPTLKHAWVLENNAFGDLLPGVFDGDGLTTYERQAQGAVDV